MLIVIALTIHYLKTKLLSEQHWPVLHDPLCYFSAGILVYYTSSFPIITFANILITDNGANSAFSVLLLIGNIFLSLGYFGAVICTKEVV